jgi:hypothetical protein
VGADTGRDVGEERIDEILELGFDFLAAQT